MTSIYEKYILLIDDDPDILNLFSDFFILNGFRCILFHSANDAINYLENNNSSFCSMVISDYCMNEMNGIELIKTINNKFNNNGNIKFILMSTFLKEQVNNVLNSKLEKLKIDNILEKPIKLERLKSINLELLST
ncbi:MAG: response regulator [Nitrososphaeraceae archaeon]